jgi:hypothetical protein
MKKRSWNKNRREIIPPSRIAVLVCPGFQSPRRKQLFAKDSSRYRQTVRPDDLPRFGIASRLQAMYFPISTNTRRFGKKPFGGD